MMNIALVAEEVRTIVPTVVQVRHIQSVHHAGISGRVRNLLLLFVAEGLNSHGACVATVASASARN